MDITNYDYLQHFKTSYNYLIYLRTYSRWIPELNRREVWPETVDRYMSFMKKKMGDKFTSDEYQEMENAILNMEVLGSQRLLQFSGPAAEKNNVCIYNCCFVGIENLKDFSDILFILACGTGVGFSCESRYISKLPTVKEQTGESVNFVIQDTRESWADSLFFGMSSWYEGRDVVFDYSLIRPKGARLITTGGRASGKEPLVNLHKTVRKIILENQGKQLTSINVHDIICMIGTIIVSGGIRRSAIISLSDLNDEDMRTAKMGEFWNTEPQRCMSNNSAVYTEKPEFDVFKREWDSLVASGSGERGIFNKSNLHEQLPERRIKQIYNELGNIGTNPCVTGDSWVQTTLGPRKVVDLMEPFEIPYQKSKYRSKGFYSTGIKEVYRLTTYNGYSMDLTKDHPVVCLRYNSRLKIELSNLQLDDVICLSNHREHSWVSEKEGTFEDGYKYGSEVHFQAITDLLDSNFDQSIQSAELMSYKMYLGFIKAITELSGITSGKSVVIELYSLKLGAVVHRMLYRVGVISVLINDTIYIYDDNIDQLYNLIYSDNRTPSSMYFKMKALYNSFSFNQESFTDRVKSIELIGSKQVYDTTIEGIHEFCCNGICSSNCGEIYLLSKQFCNLSTVVCRPDDNEESLKRKIRIATMLGTYQSSLTDFKYISPEFKENVEKERLLGVSMTGQHDCLFLQQNINILTELKELAIETNRIYAERFGINQSTAITCVKPEGTTSEMVGSSSGIHARYSPYYIRRVRIAATDPLAKMLLDQNVDCSPENGETWENVRTYVFAFPQKSPEGSRCIDDMRAIDQLEYWKTVKTQFTEHNPSTTVKVRPEEWDIARNWLLDNWKYVGGLAFLPTDSVYKLAPFEKITEEQYLELTKNTKKIDFSLLSSYEKEDTTDIKRQYACVGDNCTI